MMQWHGEGPGDDEETAAEGSSAMQGTREVIHGATYSNREGYGARGELKKRENRGKQEGEGDRVLLRLRRRGVTRSCGHGGQMAGTRCSGATR